MQLLDQRSEAAVCAPTVSGFRVQKCGDTLAPPRQKQHFKTAATALLRPPAPQSVPTWQSPSGDGIPPVVKSSRWAGCCRSTPKTRAANGLGRLSGSALCLYFTSRASWLCKATSSRHLAGAQKLTAHTVTEGQHLSAEGKHHPRTFHVPSRHATQRWIRSCGNSAIQGSPMRSLELIKQ